MTKDKDNNTDVYKLLENRMEAFCRKVQELRKEFPGLTREQEEKNVDRLIDEFVHTAVAKLLNEETDSDGRERLRKDAEELREYVKSLKAKYLK